MVVYSAYGKVEQKADCLDQLMAGCSGHYLVGKKDQQWACYWVGCLDAHLVVSTVL
jgi:hypothetical protein